MSTTLTREQAHALYTVREHPCLTAGELAHFYNTECLNDRFDDVPATTPGGLATRLSALRQRGLVVSRHGATVDWEITAAGDTAFEDAVALHWNQREGETT